MSQVITPAQPPGPPGQQPAPQSGQSVLPTSAPPTASAQGRDLIARIREGTRSGFEGTPGRLRLIALGVIFGCLITGFGGGWALNQRSSALSEARSTTQHLVQLQRVQTNLLQADAAITNSFLQGGLENPDQLNTYYTSIDQATRDLAEAARASDADASALAKANTSLARYTGLIEAARANNRQFLPVGANYLKSGTASLTSDVIGPVQLRATADRKSVDSALDQAQNASWMLLLVALLGLGLLIGSQFVLARTTRRILNLPAAAATVAVAGVLLVSAIGMAVIQSNASDVRTGAYADTVQLASARVAAFTAKSTESLGLISRGSGGGQTEVSWKEQAATAGQLPRVAASAAADLAAYRTAHQAIRVKDDSGDWDDAVVLAVATNKGSANADFSAYADGTERSLADRAQAASDGLGTTSWLLPLLAVLLGLTGVVAAIVGWFGVSLRMGEYR